MWGTDGLRNALAGMSPGRRRLLAVGGLGAIVVGAATWFETKTVSSSAVVDRARAVSEVLLDGDTRNLTIGGLAGQIDKLEEEYKDLSDKVAQTQSSTAAGILAIQGKLDQQPSAAAPGTDTVARSEIEALDKRVAAASRAAGADGQSAAAAPLAIASVYGPQAPMPPPVANGDVTPSGAPSALSDDTVTMHYFTAKETDPASVPAKPVLQEYQIPAGSILSGTLVTGLDAPTSDASRRDPIPLLLRIKDLAILPNRFRADVRECFVLLSAYGDLSSERAYARGEQISCVANDGTTIEDRLEGFASDETGKNGIVGRVVSKQGAFIARALTVSMMQGVAQAFSAANASSPVSVGETSADSLELVKSNSQSGVSNGIGLGMEKIADFYLQQATDMFPVIEVSAGRQIDVILTEGVKMALPNQNFSE